jgi:putative Holliday junction resolvase
VGHILGVDYGTKRLGFAISDEAHIIATPHSVARVTSLNDAVAAAARLCAEQDVEMAVVGMPYNMDGSIGPAAEAARKFMDRLKDKTGLPVEPFDERLTTSMVERALVESDAGRATRREVRDKLAAQVILQGYLDSRSFQDE